LFTEAVRGVALRSMKAPGTAYDDPVLGKDPQPATMADYVETTDDNGGVHLNSGIPNHAFYLAAVAVGGPAWEAVGQVWYDVLTGGALAADADFAAFAAATAQAASARFGAGSPVATAVAQAWAQVGLPVGAGAGPGAAETGGASAPSGPPAPVGVPVGTVVVRRTGGFAGQRLERELPLDALPQDQAQRWSRLLGSGLLQALPEHQPAPDRFVYRVLWQEAALDVTAGEHELPSDVRSLLEDSLRDDALGGDGPGGDGLAGS
jgi:hypothetical protein